MAEFTRFEEGDDILATKMMGNFDYVLERVGNNAENLQNYVEGEVATIKSNVSSVQATLQEGINKVDNLLTKTIENMFIAITPDYANRNPLETRKQYEATSSGVLYLRVPIVEGSSSASITINGISFDLGSGLTNREGNHSSVLLLPVAKGDTYKIDAGTNRSWFSAYFIPYRGLEV